MQGLDVLLLIYFRVSFMDKPGSYERTRFLNNQASRRFRLRKRAETETVKAYSVVLQRVNVTLRKREETLRQLRDVLLEAYINIKDSSGLDLAKLQSLPGFPSFPNTHHLINSHDPPAIFSSV